MKKLFIKNRKGQKLAVLLENVKNQKGLAFVMHGLGGFKEQPHIKTFARAFVEAGYTTLRFDTTNTFGESDGNYEGATITNYYEDLEDAIKWASGQEWYQEPFILAGHSLGGMCIGLFAEKYPQMVKALAPIAAAVSGRLSAEADGTEEMEKWKKTGWKIRESVSKPDLIKRLKWSYVADSLKYDLLPLADKLTMSALLIVGEKDESTPPAHQKILFDKLPGPKELHIIKGAPHTFRETEHLAELKKIFESWVKKL